MSEVGLQMVVTQRALKALREARSVCRVAERVVGVRVSVHASASPEAAHELEWVSLEEPWPRRALVEDVWVVADEQSARLLDGAVMDFVETMWRWGFTFERSDDTRSGGVMPAVKEALRQRVEPAVAAHGGSVRLADVKDGIAYVALEGRCGGCGMAGVTFRDLVRDLLLAAVPELTDVLPAESLLRAP